MGFFDSFSRSTKKTPQRFASYRLSHQDTYTLQSTGRKFKSINEMIKYLNLAPDESVLIADHLTPDHANAVVIRNTGQGLTISLNSGPEQPYQP